MSFDLNFSSHPTLFSVIKKHDIYSRYEDRCDSLVDDEELLSEIKPEDTMKITPTTTHGIIQEPQKDVSCLQKIKKCNAFHFCCRCLRKNDMIDPIQQAAMARTGLLEIPSITVDAGVLINQSRKHYGVIAIQPSSIQLATIPIFQNLNPSTYYDPRFRAKTLPDQVEVDFKALAWRQNMIKDTVLPDKETCEFIIKERDQRELTILKMLFSKPEHQHKFRNLSLRAQNALDQIILRPESPILQFLSSSPNLGIRPQRSFSAPESYH